MRNLLLYFAPFSLSKFLFPIRFGAAMWKREMSSCYGDRLYIRDRSISTYSILYREDPFQVLLPISLLLIPPTWMNPSTTHNLHAHTTHPSIRVSRLSFSSFLYFFSVELAPIFFFYPPFWVIWGVRSTLNMRKREIKRSQRNFNPIRWEKNIARAVLFHYWLWVVSFTFVVIFRRVDVVVLSTIDDDGGLLPTPMGVVGSF